MPARDRRDAQLDVLLRDLAQRLAGAGDGEVLIRRDDLPGAEDWAWEALGTAGFLMLDEPAQAVICDGCDQGCAMAVERAAGRDGETAAFVVCDRRDDIGRVPVDLDRLRQWRLSMDQVARILATLLRTDGRTRELPEAGRMVGALTRGSDRIDVALRATPKDDILDQELTVTLTDDGECPAIPSISLTRLLRFRKGRLEYDRSSLDRTLRRRWGEKRTACEVVSDGRNVCLVNHVTGEQRIIASPQFDSSNDNAFQALYERSGQKLTLDELRKITRDPTIEDLHKVVENLNFVGPPKRLFFRVSKGAIQFDRTVTLSQLKVQGIDPKEII